jgi:dUTP pyrophosphatase
MNRVGEFEKVSYEQYRAAMLGALCTEYAEELISESYDRLQLPIRATGGSAGYDFFAPISFSLDYRQTIKIPTGIRVKIDEGWWLGVLPRSSLGFKHRIQLDNTMGVVDSDYYFSDNEGHLFVKITCDRTSGGKLSVKEGDRFMQAIFLPYGITYSDDAKGVRNGGYGSTGS